MNKNIDPKNEKQRVAVFIDGSNFYYKLKSLSIRNITYFDYSGLSQWLAKERNIVAKTYFIGVVRAKSDDVRGQMLRKNQRNFSVIFNRENKVF